MAGTSVVVDLLLRGRDAASTVIGRVRDGIAGVGNAVSAALEPLRSFGALIGAAIGVGGAKELIDRADAYTRLSNQVRVATSSEQDYHESLAAVAAVTQRANSDLDSTASLYGKVKQAASSLGISQQQVADVTETIAKGMQLSGAETATAAGATLQFTQALAAGVLRGDEFNSVMEASPALIKAIADGLGVAVGDMRAMAEAGQLTSDRVVRALLSQKQAIDETYGKLPQTVGQALGQLNNAATLFVGRLNEQTGATQTLGEGLKFLANNMDAVASVMGAAFAASVAKGAQSMAQFVAASIAARDASRQQAIAAEQQQAANLAAAQGQVAAAQAAYNRALAEQRATAAQLAALESLAGLFASEEALAAARAQATVAANAASAATQRYAAAQAALNAVQAPAAAGVGLVGRALGFLAGPGGLILTAVSALGLLYAAFSKQKPVTDELAQSIDRYADSLEKLNQAQLEAASVRIGEAIRDQTQAVADAAAEVERLKSGHVGLWEALTETKARAQLLTEAQGALADASAKLADLEAKREILLRQSADAQQQNAASNLAQVTAYNQQITALDRLASNLGDREKYLKQVNDAEIKQTQALLDQAIASGKLAEADRLALQLAAQKATAAEQAATLARAEALAEDAKIAAMEQVRDLQGSLTKTQQEALSLARDTAAAKRTEADAAQAVAARLQEEARNVDLLVVAEKKKLEQGREISGLYERLKSASAAYYDALIEQAQGEGRERDARTLTIEKLKEQVQYQDLINQQKQLEAERQRDILAILQQEAERRKTNNEVLDAEFQLKLKQQDLNVKIAEAEAGTAAAQAKTAQTTADLTAKIQQFVAAGFDETEAKKRALLVSGQFTEALKIEEQQHKKTTEATKEQKNAIDESVDAEKRAASAAQEHAAAVAAAGDFVSGALSDWAQRLQALSPAARKAFDGFSQNADLARGSIEAINAALAKNLDEQAKLTGAGSGFAAWANQVADKALDIEASFLAQARAAETLVRQLETAGNSTGLDILIRKAEMSRAQFDLLDQQRLDNLKSAIDA
ncbi:MAG: tape measure protein, partial [Candidatus Competibacter sp.]|nr:tape measure protein [Candidatus Competibacter sp.]